MLCSKIMLDLFYKLVRAPRDASVFWAGLLAAGFFATELISPLYFKVDHKEARYVRRSAITRSKHFKTHFLSNVGQRHRRGNWCTTV